MAGARGSALRPAPAGGLHLAPADEGRVAERAAVHLVLGRGGPAAAEPVRAAHRLLFVPLRGPRDRCEISRSFVRILFGYLHLVNAHPSIAKHTFPFEVDGALATVLVRWYPFGLHD